MKPPCWSLTWPPPNGLANHLRATRSAVDPLSKRVLEHKSTASLIEEHIGFEAIDDGLWDVYFFHCRLGRFDERRKRIIDDRTDVSTLLPAKVHRISLE